jgi:hypothetical protein
MPYCTCQRTIASGPINQICMNNNFPSDNEESGTVIVQCCYYYHKKLLRAANVSIDHFPLSHSKVALRNKLLLTSPWSKVLIENIILRELNNFPNLH